jgi:probable rRNA maturation factor
MIHLQLAGSISDVTLGEQELKNLKDSVREALQYVANVGATRSGQDEIHDREEYLPDSSLVSEDGSPLPPDRSLTLVVTDDAQVQSLNRDFLGIDEPTDVLSFPSGESAPDPDTGEIYLGDIIISYPRAQAQAEAGGHPIQQELQLLVVHGVLHLLGYDHAEEEEKAEMWAAQEAVLIRLGSSLRPPE